MGIDSRILIRNPKTHAVNAEQAFAAAVKLAKIVGSDNFIIKATYGDDWAWEKHHAITIIEPLTEKSAKEYDEHPRLTGKTVWFQDGPEIVANDNEQFLQCHLSQRFYGQGYERGDWPVIRSTLEVLQKLFPHAEIWYGGDSSGVCAEHYGASKIAEVTDHYYTVGHEPYRGYGSRAGAHTCPFCKVETHECGGGGGRGLSGSYDFLNCDGCGTDFIRHEQSGEVEQVTREDMRNDDSPYGRGTTAAKKRLFDRLKINVDGTPQQ